MTINHRQSPPSILRIFELINKSEQNSEWSIFMSNTISIGPLLLLKPLHTVVTTSPTQWIQLCSLCICAEIPPHGLALCPGRRLTFQHATAVAHWQHLQHSSRSTLNTGGLHPKNIQKQNKAGFVSKVLTDCWEINDSWWLFDVYIYNICIYIYMLDYVSVCHCMFMCLMDTDCRRGEPNGAGLSLSASFSLSSFCSGERLSLLEDHPSKLPQLVPSQSRAPQQCRRQCGKFEHPLEHLEQSTKQICLQPHPVSAANSWQ